GALLATVFVVSNLIDSPTGRALRALHTSEVAAEVTGIDTARHKLLAFVVSASLAAFAGALVAFYSGFVTPAKASFLHSIELVTMVVFGGMASTAGAIVGAAVLTVLPQVLTSLKDYEMVVFGALLMATMIFFPRGVVPTLAALWRRWRPLPPALAPVYRGEPAQARDSSAARPASPSLPPAGVGQGEGLAPA